MRFIMVAVIGLLVAGSFGGCAGLLGSLNAQNFLDDVDDWDRQYEIVEQPDGTMVSLMIRDTGQRHIIKGKNKTAASPIGGSAVADAHLNMTDAEWTVMMGQISDLYGGDMTEIVNSLIEAGVLTATGGASALTRLGVTE